MSTIDGYRHRCLGIVSCPSHYDLVVGNAAYRFLPIYRLDEDALDEWIFQGKRGDILVGGGHGERPALRISVPEAFYFYTHEDWEQFAGVDTWEPATISKAYWSMTHAYVFGDGYHTAGWEPTKSIERWLTEHVLSFLVRHYRLDYARYLGGELLEEDGSICRLPTIEEEQF